MLSTNNLTDDLHQIAILKLLSISFSISIKIQTYVRKYNNYELRVIRERKSLLVWIWSTCQAGFCWDSDLFGTPKHLFLSLPVPSDRLGANVKMSSTPFFPQKSFAKKFSKIQGQIWNNPLSNLNLAWEICEAFFCWLFAYLFVLSFWAEFTDCSALSQMKWYTASQNLIQ